MQCMRVVSRASAKAMAGRTVGSPRVSIYFSPLEAEEVPRRASADLFSILAASP
jgi:hypothetical protein